MGSSCSRGAVTLNENSSSSPSSHGSSVTQTTNTAKTIQSPTIWNPFQITKNEAEEFLKASDPGSFVFSHDVTSELYLSLSVGKYVCHHSVVTRENALYVGAKRFDTVGEVIEYFTDHPLGEMTLKEEYKRPAQATSIIQVRQHPDISIPTNTPSTSDITSSDSDLAKATLSIQHPAFSEKSPALRRPTTNHRTPVERIEEESKNWDENEENETKNNLKNKKNLPLLPLPRNKVAPLPKKPLVRSQAVEQTGSSSDDEREVPSRISLMPIIPQDCVTTTTKISNS